MERSGVCPRLVEGHDDNIKITRAEDMALAEFYLARAGQTP
jgi:2-C-methyl-D-erythritol 4-phosphate cytidylyltransferase